MKVELIREEVAFNEFFKIYKAELSFERFDGKMSTPVTRYSFEKPDAVAVLIHHASKDSFVLVRQFRYPPYHHHVDPWLCEIVAGGVEEDEDEVTAARREVEEETGFKVLHLERICKCYVSPGLMSERVTIFVAEVDELARPGKGGGAKGEDEDIELIWIPRSEALQWIDHQKVGDAKTIIAMQWHLMHK